MQKPTATTPPPAPPEPPDADAGWPWLAPLLTLLILLIAAIAVTSAEAQTPTERTPMNLVAKGSFSVQIKPQGEAATADGVSLGRMSLDKTFEGDFTGSGQGQMLTATTAVNGSAGYVAIERLTGTLNGRSGSFAMQHSGTMNRGAQQLSITIVPDSGTGELAGIAGVFKLDITGGKHRYELTYTLPVPLPVPAPK